MRSELHLNFAFTVIAINVVIFLQKCIFFIKFANSSIGLLLKLIVFL